MTAGWVLPRDWDAGRLLRFLTGLALLALAFAANAGLIATPAAPAPPGPTTATTTVDVSAAEVAPAPAPATRPVPAAAVIEIGDPIRDPALTAGPAGAVPGSYGSRAPPAV